MEICNRADLFDVTLQDILNGCELSEKEYNDALKIMQKKMSVTGVYGLLTYLTSYLCKPEHTMGELMKKASKEATGEGMKGKLRKIGNVFLTKQEVSSHEAIKRVLSLSMRTSNIDVIYLD